MSVFNQMNSLSTGSGFSRNLPSSSGVLSFSNSNIGNFDNLRNVPVEANESSFNNEVTGSEESAAIPELALIQMAQNAGSGLNSILNTVMNNNISTQYQTSLSTGHGIGLVQMAQNQATSAYARSSLEDMGGKLGAMFGGPLGALAGRGIASLFETPVTGAIANSPTGTFNPQSGGTPQSQSSAQAIPESSNTVQATKSQDLDNSSTHGIISSISIPNNSTLATTTDNSSVNENVSSVSSSPDNHIDFTPDPSAEN